MSLAAGPETEETLRAVGETFRQHGHTVMNLPVEQDPTTRASSLTYDSPMISGNLPDGLDADLTRLHAALAKIRHSQQASIDALTTFIENLYPVKGEYTTARERIAMSKNSKNISLAFRPGEQWQCTRRSGEK